MTENELVEALALFAKSVRDEVKGLTSKISWHLYGTNSEYTILFGVSADTEAKVQAAPKTRVDWETYVMIEGGGALQGRMTGKPERKPGGFTGNLEERRDMYYIHQLLGPNLSTLKTQCEVRHAALAARAALMNSEPHRTAAILFYHEYLKSVYKSTSAVTSAILDGLARFPGQTPPEELLARWEETEAQFKLDRPSSLFEIKDGRLYVYEKIGKEKRLINGWLFGLEKETPKEKEESEPVSQYEREIKDVGFHNRMKLMDAEAKLLLGDGSDDMVSLIADHKAGTLSRILTSLEQFSNLNPRELEDAQKKMMRALVDHGERITAAAAKRPRLAAAFGINIDDLVAAAGRVQKIKRKLG